MSTRAQAEIERQRTEQGERFINQLGDMFKAQRQDMDQKFVPRPEFSAHMEKMDQVLEGLEKTVERIGGNVATFHDNAPVRFADKAETKQEIAVLRTDIAKLETALDALKDRQFGNRIEDVQRSYGARFEDIQGRYKGEAAVEQQVNRQATRIDDRTLQWLFLLILGVLTVVGPHLWH